MNQSKGTGTNDDRGIQCAQDAHRSIDFDLSQITRENASTGAETDERGR